MNRRLRSRGLAWGLALGMGVCTSIGAQAQSQGSPTIKRLSHFLLIEKLSTGGQAIPENTYTRLEIQSSPPIGDSVKYAVRNLFWRIGIGKKYSFNAVIQAKAGIFKTTVPILSREYESSSKSGEKFTRVVDYDSMEFPYFLSGSDGPSRVGGFTVKADMSETSDSQISALTLSAVREALKAVAPSSAILTSLTKDSSDTIAEKIDAEAGKLFGTSTSESVSFDIPLEGVASYKITVRGPDKELDEFSDSNILGVWTVRFSTPKPSIFSTTTCTTSTCDWKAAFDSAVKAPDNVLAFKLVEQIAGLGSVKSYLAQQEWWAGQLQALEKTTASNAPEFGTFCRKIRGAISDLGLNGLDGRIVATSVAGSGLVSGKIKTGMAAAADCNYASL